MGWFDTSESDAFAREISTEFARIFPAAAANDARTAEEKLRRAIEVLGNRAAKFHHQQRLGWFRKARFLRTIKESLAASGHADALVDKIVYAVALRMARRDGGS